MARLTHSQLALMAGLELLPPTLLVILDHPQLGAATLGAVLVVSALQSWMLIRSERDWQRDILSYAQDNIYMGRDPTKVIAALRAAAAGVLLDPQPPSSDQRRHPGDRIR